MLSKLLMFLFLFAPIGVVGVAVYQALADDGTLPPSALSSPANAPVVSDPQYGTGIVNVQYESAPRPNNRDLPQGAVPDVGTNPNPRVYHRVDCEGAQLGYLRSEMRDAYNAFVQNGTQWNYENWIYAKQNYDNAILRCSGY